jgi:hypothetical protein
VTNISRRELQAHLDALTAAETASGTSWPHIRREIHYQLQRGAGMSDEGTDGPFVDLDAARQALRYPDRFDRIEKALMRLERRVRERDLTGLETLVQDSMHRSLTHGLGRASELLADELVHDLLRDPAVKAELVGLLKRALIDTLTDLGRARGGGEAGAP